MGPAQANIRQGGPDGRSGGCSLSVSDTTVPPSYGNLSRRKTCTNNPLSAVLQLVHTEEVDSSQLFRATGRVQGQCGADPSSCVADGTVSVARLGHMPVQVAAGGIAIRAEPFQADRYDGSPSHPAGRGFNSLPPGPNSLRERGVINLCGGGRCLLCRAIAI